MTRTAAVKRSSMVKALLDSDEPSIRWKVRTQVLGEDPASPAIGDSVRRSATRPGCAR